MSGKLPPGRDSEVKGGSADFLRVGTTTQTIDLDGIFSADITESGSFDIRGDIWTTTFGKLLQALPIPAVLIDFTGAVLVTNQAWGRVTPEYEAIQNRPFRALFPEVTNAAEVQALLDGVFSTRKPARYEAALKIHTIGIWARITFRSIRIRKERFVLALVEDLTRERDQIRQNELLQRELVLLIEELKRANTRLNGEIESREEIEQKLRSSLQEKEVLLREIHHRVKNNLASVIGLLGLQSEYADNDMQRRSFMDSQDRIRSMALAHEKLYESQNLAELDLKEYIVSLVDHLSMSFPIGHGTIIMSADVEDISLGLDTAIPLGMAISELVSNAYKHAFPDFRDGEIHVAIRILEETLYQAVVTDNGVGIPEDVTFEHPPSLGMDLVATFVDQLDGQIEIVRENGTTVRFTFTDRSKPRAHR